MVMATLLALLVVGSLPANATAFRWHLRYGQAKRETWRHARQRCARVGECEAYAAGTCRRRSDSRFDCVMGLFFPGAEGPKEIECNSILHWGVRRGGYVTLQYEGRPHCFTVE